MAPDWLPEGAVQARQASTLTFRGVGQFLNRLGGAIAQI